MIMPKEALYILEYHIHFASSYPSRHPPFMLYIETRAEPAYSYIVFIRFSAVVEIKLIPFVYIPLLIYPSCNRLLL